MKHTVGGDLAQATRREREERRNVGAAYCHIRTKGIQQVNYDSVHTDEMRVPQDICFLPA